MSQTIQIFLASSKELQDDREKFEQFIGRKNKLFKERSIFINLVIWEDFIDVMSQTRLQDEYNKAVRESDIFVMLFATKVGKYTLEEFETAYRHFKETNKPKILTYLKTNQIILTDIPRENIQSLWAFQDKLKDLGHFLTEYNNCDDLINKFNDQLEKLVNAGLGQIPSPGQERVLKYLNTISQKYAVLSMIGFHRQFPMDDIYIPLTVHPDPESRFPCRPEKTTEKTAEKVYAHALKAEDLLELPEKTAVVLGEPGMGKTTMLHYLARKVSQKSPDLFPILVKLAEFSKSREPLEACLLATVENHIPGLELRDAARKAIEEEKALILLDGLDEVSREEYSSVTERIRSFIAAHPGCRVIITSRNAGFLSHEVPYHLFEIDKLPFGEIAAFIEKWFKRETDLAGRIVANHRLLELAQNPFLLSIICLIYERKHDLPKRRVELYRECAVTLLELNDKKNIPRANKFSRFDKEEILKSLAYHFFKQGIDEFPFSSLAKQVRETLTHQKRDYKEEDILSEIRENSGLLQKSNDLHFFMHRTFYEYYVACKMRENDVWKRAAEARWEEPIRLYAAQITSVSEGTEFLRKLWDQDRALALRCYPDMERVVEPECIENLLKKAGVKERVELVKGLPEKVADPVKVVETLRELFRWETNGEVLYWGAEILEGREEMKVIPGALEIVRKKLDEGARERYQKHIAGDMVPIPAGEFLMGSPDYEEGRDEEEIQHRVKVKEFFISRYPVTNRLYEVFDPEHRNRRDEYSDSDDQPVLYVNWYEAVIFCRYMGCRLPTEAEWEYACRAGSETPFNTGENLSSTRANFG